VIAADLSFFNVLWYAVAGLIIGVVARFLVPGRQHLNIFVTMGIGVVSAIVGGIAWNAIFRDQRGVAWIGGVIVAVIILWLYGRSVRNKGAAT
jgi:uncharacterized membrane protein YeaQ/YmgE (transglycosylase-associated protein family)